MFFVEIIKTVLIGIIQGITEWLPISSTGHMILFNALWPLEVPSEFWEMFSVVIQLGSIMAVVVLYFRKLNPFAPSKSAQDGTPKALTQWRSQGSPKQRAPRLCAFTEGLAVRCIRAKPTVR